MKLVLQIALGVVLGGLALVGVAAVLYLTADALAAHHVDRALFHTVDPAASGGLL